MQDGELEVEGGLMETLKSSTYGENLRQGGALARKPLRFPRHLRVVHVGSQKILARQDS